MLLPSLSHRFLVAAGSGFPSRSRLTQWIRTLAVMVILGWAADCGKAQATTYYVDAHAKPYGSGTIPEPFQTIAAAVELVEAGDTILIRSGVYEEAVTIRQDRVSLAAWGASLPELRGTQGPSLTIHADDCRIKRLRFTGNAGVRIEGAANSVRNCIFDGCAAPLSAQGRAHTILLCLVRQCRARGEIPLFDVAGPGSYVGWNRFLQNSGSKSAAVSCRGRGCVVRDNIVFGDAEHSLRYGVLSESGTENTQFESCAEQKIAYNRFYGGVQSAYVRIAGELHASTQIIGNTIVNAGEATAIHSDVEDVTIDRNLVDPQIEFASTDPHDPAFLWPRAVAAVDPTDIPKAYVGARPVWPGLDVKQRTDRSRPRNLVLGRAYLFSSEPRHGSRDLWPICLTDGYAPQSMWGERDGGDFTGWHINGIDNRLYFWFDLGELSDIDAVRAYAPHQHVWRAGMPLQIDVSISTDDMEYRRVGAIRPELPRLPGNYWDQVDGLRARGRYVLLTLYTDWAYTGIGEIEIWGTKAEDDTPPFLAGPVPRTLDEILLAGTQTPWLGISSVGEAYMGRYRTNKADLLAIEQRAAALGVRQEVSEVVRKTAVAIKKGSSPDARANPEVVAAIGRLSRAVLQSAYGEEQFFVSASTPYEKFSSSHVPLREEVGVEAVSISACGDEREPAAFFVTNATDADAELRIDVSACVSAEGAVFPADQIVLRSPVDFTIGDPTRKFKGDYFHDKNNALVLLDHGEGHRLTIKSLDIRQVWVIVDTTDVTAGTYRGTVTLVADPAQLIRLPLTITVHPIRIPEQLDLYAYMWSYWRASRMVNFRPEAYRDAIRHKANTILDHAVPHPVDLEDGVDEEGHLVKPLNYDVVDSQIDQWNASFREKSNRVRFYIFWLAFGNQGYEELRMGIPVGTPKWNTLVVEWLNDIAAHLHKRHSMTTDQFAFYLRDELEARQVVGLYKPMADALRAADPERYPYARKIKLFVNPMAGAVMSSSWQFFEEHYDKLGLLAPLAADYPARVLESLHRSGNLVWSHSTVGKNAGYQAKLTGWRCMQKGFGGMGFFIYIYSRYPNSYDRVYTRKDKVPGAGDEVIVPSRSWEAWRDGQEDWYLLSHLKRAAHEVRNSAPRKFARGMKTFHNAIDTVFATPEEPRTAVVARETIIAEILRLRVGH